MRIAAGPGQATGPKAWPRPAAWAAPVHVSWVPQPHTSIPVTLGSPLIIGAKQYIAKGEPKGGVGHLWRRAVS